MEKQKWISDTMGRMTLEQKTGQLLVLGFCGPVITPDIAELAGKYYVGGFAFGAPKDLGTVLTCFNPGGRECLNAAARAVFGLFKAGASLDISQE